MEIVLCDWLDPAHAAMLQRRSISRYPVNGILLGIGHPNQASDHLQDRRTSRNGSPMFSEKFEEQCSPILDEKNFQDHLKKDLQEKTNLGDHPKSNLQEQVESPRMVISDPQHEKVLGELLSDDLRLKIVLQEHLFPDPR